MKKENLIAQLEGAKALSSQVDIDKVIELLNQLEPEVVTEKVFGITEELANRISNRIEECLDYNSRDVVDLGTAEFELSYDNRIELNSVDIDVYEIIRHVDAVLGDFVVEEDEAEDDGFVQAQQEAAELDEEQEEGILKDINQGLGLEPGGNPYAE
jgi:hypothetical protein